MFGSLLQRPLVAADALDRYPLLVSMLDRELDCCKLLFDKHIQTAEELGESRSLYNTIQSNISAQYIYIFLARIISLFLLFHLPLWAFLRTQVPLIELTSRTKKKKKKSNLG